MFEPLVNQTELNLMKLKPVFRKATEISIGLTAVATLILAGCGGGGGNTSPTPVATTNATINPYKGPFVQGATVTLKDANGNPITLVSGGTINASGVANVTFNSNVTYPLLVEVVGSYYNEVSRQPETSTTPLRSVIANVAATTNAPVTIVTETAVAYLKNQLGGSFSAAHPVRAASAVAALSAAGIMLGIPASAVPAFDPLTHKTSDTHTLGLAALAVVASNQVTSGTTLAEKVAVLANSMATMNPASAPTDVISQASMNAAMTSITSGASNVMAAGVVTPVAPNISTASLSLTMNNATIAASNSIIGSWYLSGGPSHIAGLGQGAASLLTFFTDGHYTHSQTSLPGTPVQQATWRVWAGVEYGTYTFNQSTGAFITACPTVDTNGTGGPSGEYVGGFTLSTLPTSPTDFIPKGGVPIGTCPGTNKTVIVSGNTMTIGGVGGNTFTRVNP